jgi:hypothetical protein
MSYFNSESSKGILKLAKPFRKIIAILLFLLHHTGMNFLYGSGAFGMLPAGLGETC